MHTINWEKGKKANWKYFHGEACMLSPQQELFCALPFTCDYIQAKPYFTKKNLNNAF
jgi:hypothetical protein